MRNKILCATCFMMVSFFNLIEAQTQNGIIDSPGDIAFVAYHDDDDGFSFVFLDDCPSGAIIRFIDEEWDGSMFVSATSEGEVTWENNTGAVISAGTVVNITDADDNGVGIMASIGVATESDSGFNLSASLATEQIYAITGTRSTPGVFLTFIGSTSNASLANTNLTLGSTAVQITAEGYYSGSTDCSATIADCSAMINTAGSWTTGGFNYPADVVNAITFSGTLSVHANNELALKAFPNPVVDHLNLLSDNRIDKVEIYNLLGHNLKQIPGNSNRMILDVSEMVSGTYFVKVISKEKSVVLPLVKK